MARRQGGRLFYTFSLGVLTASVFWIYLPYLRGEMARPMAVEAGVLGLDLKEAAALPGQGSRFQLLNDGKEVLLADLREGRVWRYFHLSRDSKEEEGFLSVPMFYEGKQYSRASEAGYREPAKGEDARP